VLEPPSSSNVSADLRLTAVLCGVLSAHAESAGDCETLSHLERSLIELARREDWVDGPPPLPPARSAALAVPS
jgi:hypothetical protein